MRECDGFDLVGMGNRDGYPIRDNSEARAVNTMCVRTINGWADVIGMIRDLRGFKVVVWQDRTGMMGAMMASEAYLRINGKDIEDEH